MLMYQREKSRYSMSERGAALVVSLILLLIMTIIGVAAMNGARLEVSMAGMMQREEVALRSAERTLAEAERYAENNIDNHFSTEVEGHYLPGTEPDVSQTDWTFLAIPIEEEGEEDSRDEFIVEYLGLISLPGSALNDGGDPSIPGDKINTYRISARSETKGNAVRIVESIYTKLYNPMAP
jgi:type IV pilus assembly protein PilX